MSAPGELSDFWHAVDAIGAAERRVEEAEQQLRDARERAHRELRLYGNRVQEAGEAPPLSLLRRLYWEHPEIRATEIAFVFGLRHAGQVHKHAGPGTYEAPCLGECGRSVQHSRTSRTAPITTWPPGRDVRYCATCQVERHAEWVRQTRERERAVAIAEREEDAILQVALDEGRATVTTITEIEYGHIRRYRTEQAGGDQ